MIATPVVAVILLKLLGLSHEFLRGGKSDKIDVIGGPTIVDEDYYDMLDVEKKATSNLSWKRIQKNEVLELYSAVMPGTGGICAYKGYCEVDDISVQELVDVYLDIKGATKWVKDLMEYELFETVESSKLGKGRQLEKKIGRMLYFVPCPGVQPREFIITHSLIKGKETETEEGVQINLKSLFVDDNGYLPSPKFKGRFPIKKGSQRGHMIQSNWTFKKVGNKTVIEMDFFVQPLVPNLPLFTINAVQRLWLPITLKNLLKECRSRQTQRGGVGGKKLLVEAKQRKSLLQRILFFWK